MRYARLLSGLLSLLALGVAGLAWARPYIDPESTVFEDLGTWELILYGLLALALTAAFLFVLVKLINLFFAKK